VKGLVAAVAAVTVAAVVLGATAALDASTAKLLHEWRGCVLARRRKATTTC
jgi:hypothetical protein